MSFMIEKFETPYSKISILGTNGNCKYKESFVISVHTNDINSAIRSINFILDKKRTSNETKT